MPEMTATERAKIHEVVHIWRRLIISIAAAEGNEYRAIMAWLASVDEVVGVCTESAITDFQIEDGGP